MSLRIAIFMIFIKIVEINILTNVYKIKLKCSSVLEINKFIEAILKFIIHTKTGESNIIVYES